jgi:hypothetical protein
LILLTALPRDACRQDRLRLIGMSDDAARGPILIVDENEANSIMAIRLLEEQGYPAISRAQRARSHRWGALIRWSLLGSG